MPGIIATPAAAPSAPALGFSVAHQKVELELDFEDQIVKGKTEITIHPHFKEFRIVRLNFRQGVLNRLSVNGKAASAKYVDPYDSLHLYGVHYHRKLSSKLAPLLKTPPEPELTVTIPKSVRIEELDPFCVEAQTQISVRGSGAGDDLTDGPLSSKPAETSLPRFTAVTIYLEFTIENVRDGLQFVGVENGDRRYPHAFTTNSPDTNKTCCLFPCVEDMSSRCTWDISIRCPRTLRDAFPHAATERSVLNDSGKKDGYATSGGRNSMTSDEEPLDMAVACSGNMTDEIMDPRDQTKKTVSFSCSTPVSAQQIGFAVGPFEYVNLSEFRGSDEDDQLGHNAVPVHAFCLPGRGDEVRNTCLPLAKAIDFISLTYGSYPFASYKLCFVDDHPNDATATASLSICSNRILFPEDIIDLIYNSTRCLVQSLASQWVGVHIVPKDMSDSWVIVGISYYITDTFMKRLCGNNEYRYRLKLASDKVCELDLARPSIYDIGPILRLDPSEMEFLSLKAPLVLYIMERRLSKASGRATVSRIISRIFLNARMGDLPNSGLATASFQRLCEKMGHAKLDTFFQQWVFGAGCPRFQVTQRFNKKKLVVEMLIQQIQSEQPTIRDLEKSSFMRDIMEEVHTVYAGAVQSVFTGSMTIRIHEADGTPYEHIVEIKERVTKFDIPYNTKYNRLKRSKRQKERTISTAGVGDGNTGTQEDGVLLYCLGDVLQTEEDAITWRLTDWSKEDEERMNQESFEWIRMDADFEWICKLSLNQPGYMYVSQLQQDRDIVAQLEAVQYLSSQPHHALLSTFFVRTVMDKRYFYGIRVAAAKALAGHAKEEVDWVGLHHLETAFQELFCMSDSRMTCTNDFTDRASYMLQLAIPEALAQVRDRDGKAPARVKRFLYDKLRFNDNSNNELSDCYYVATLMRSLCEALLGTKEAESNELEFDMEREIALQAERKLHTDCVAEIDRYRRMDEWTSSFQNIYSRTAIECQKRLMQAKILDFNIVEFLQYTREGTFDMLRLAAFEILAAFDLFRTPEILTWFIYTMSVDLSPWLRQNMQEVFGRALASVAFGDEVSTNLETSGMDNLVIEQEATTDVRRATLARRQSVAGALEALKQELGQNATLKESLWAACNSSRMGLLQLSDLVDLCAVLYDVVESKLLVLKYPRFWKVKNVGKGILHFAKSDKFRTHLLGKPDTVPPSNSAAPKRKREESGDGQQHPPTKLTIKVAKQKAGSTPANPPPRATPAAPASSQSQPGIQRLKLKFK